MDTIAVYLVSRMKSHPSNLFEVCNFLSSTPADFLSVTLPHTLPELFASRNREALESVARELNLEVGQLLAQNGTKIIPYVFLLTKPGQTTRAMKFMTSFFVKDVPDAAKLLIKADHVDNVSTVILSMGDEDPATAFAVGFISLTFLTILANPALGEAGSYEDAAIHRR